MFGRWVQGREGLHTYCKLCMSEKCKARYRANPEPYKRRAQQWAEANPEKRKRSENQAKTRFKERNPCAAYEAAKKWAQANPDRIAAYSTTKKAKRRAAQALVWDAELDSLAFAEAADLCRRRAAACGGAWQVDHVVPLLCKQACGLHNAFNLAVVPATYNAAKKNALVPQRGFVVEARP